MKVVQSLAFIRHCFQTAAVILAVKFFIFGSMAFADQLESQIKACGWSMYQSNIAAFNEQRKRLPSEIGLEVKSCGDHGPTYTVRAKGKVVELQEGWEEGEQSTTYLFSKTQRSDQFWEFVYQGYEWSGYLWINRKTGKRVTSPGNQCGELVFSPNGKRALLVCSPEHGSDITELYFAIFGQSVTFKRLQKNPPSGEVFVDWSAPNEAKVTFQLRESKSLRRYKF